MISVIIPAVNQHEMTRECIAALRLNTRDFEVVLVDNGSTPPLGRPYAGFTDLTLIRNEENRGFPAAVNQGIRASRGDIIVLLNNDVIVTPGWADKLCLGLDRYAIVGPVTNYAIGKQRVHIGAYENETALNDLAAAWSEEHSGELREVKWVIGFCFAFRRSLYDEIGPFDESLWPCSGEEIDFCLRARAEGHKSAVAMDCYVHHEGSVTFKDLSSVDYNDLCERNNRHLTDRWGPKALFQAPEIDLGPGAVRLNLGCGRFRLQGFVNIDADEGVGPDAVADVAALPFGAESVDEIYAGHLLEHFDWTAGERVMAHWFSLLKSGGRISVSVPDFDLLAARYLERPTAARLRELNDLYLYSGAQRSPHQYAYSEPLLREVMAGAGFADLKRMPADHAYFPYAVDWQVGIEGIKP